MYDLPFSYAIYGFKINKNELANLKNKLECMHQNKLSYFYSDLNLSKNIIIGFTLAKTSYPNNMEAAVIDFSNLKQFFILLTDFINQNKLMVKPSDIKTYLLTYYSK